MSNTPTAISSLSVPYLNLIDRKCDHIHRFNKCHCAELTAALQRLVTYYTPCETRAEAVGKLIDSQKLLDHIKEVNHE